MSNENMGTVDALVVAALGEAEARRTMAMLTLDPALLRQSGETVSRAAFAMAMTIALFHDLLQRVPGGAAYVAERQAQGQAVRFDHGALRSIRFPDGPTGALPAGEDAFTRIFAPLGYEMAAVYPLDRLRMTGRAYRHADFPETIPQFFLSELHVERFDAPFKAAAARVFGASRDPLDVAAKAVLARFAEGAAVSRGQAIAVLPTILRAFDTQHPPADFGDYQMLLAQSAEAAWIATEGNAFNHATDRVDDVAALADRLRQEGWPIKDRLEISANGRVRQTALRAASVTRPFADGVERDVPGSFFEFISRDVDPASGRIDLSFDTGNATGIFAMTRAADGKAG